LKLCAAGKLKRRVQSGSDATKRGGGSAARLDRHRVDVRTRELRILCL